MWLLPACLLLRTANDSVLSGTAFTWAGILAAQAMALNSDPELGHGIAGYGRYYWRTFTDGISGTFFTEAIVPALTHEDPRYYTMGQGGFFRRTGYALSRTFVQLLTVGSLSSSTGGPLDGLFFAWPATVVALDGPALVLQHSRGDS